MKPAPNVLATVTVILIIGGMTEILYAQGEKRIKQKELPAAVQSAFIKSYPRAKIRGVSKEVEKGKTYYEIESIDGTMRRDLLYTPEGEAYEVEETIAATDLPRSVRNALGKQFKVYTIAKAEKSVHGTDIHYEVVLRSDQRTYEVSVEPAGKIVSSAEIKGRKEKKEQSEEDDDD